MQVFFGEIWILHSSCFSVVAFQKLKVDAAFRTSIGQYENIILEYQDQSSLLPGEHVILLWAQTTEVLDSCCRIWLVHCW